MIIMKEVKDDSLGFYLLSQVVCRLLCIKDFSNLGTKIGVELWI